MCPLRFLVPPSWVALGSGNGFSESGSKAVREKKQSRRAQTVSQHSSGIHKRTPVQGTTAVLVDLGEEMQFKVQPLCLGAHEVYGVRSEGPNVLVGSSA